MGRTPFLAKAGAGNRHPCPSLFLYIPSGRQSAMHLGRLYPYLQQDRWCVSTAFWPGFVPSFVIFDHSALPVEWILLNGFSPLSNLGIADGDREGVDYEFLWLGEPGASLELHLYVTAFHLGGILIPRYRLFLSDTSGVVVNQEADARGPASFTTNSPFEFGWFSAWDFVDGGPIPVPGTVPRCAVYDDLP